MPKYALLRIKTGYRLLDARTTSVGSTKMDFFLGGTLASSSASVSLAARSPICCVF